MIMSSDSAAYSYRSDPAVPDFDDSGPVTFMDGNCVLCSVGARMIARFDRASEFGICPIQTDLGGAVLAHYGMDPDDPESWLYLVDGAAYGGIDATIRVGARLGGIGLLLQPLRLLPDRGQNWVYGHIARNRYRIFGRTDICRLPDQALRDRLIG